MRSSRARLALAAAALVALLVAIVACTRKGDAPDTPPRVAAPDAAQGVAVDVDLLAYLSLARALHHEANLKEDMGDLEGAVKAMNHLVTARQPAGAPPEVDEVLADAYARRAELEIKQPDLDAAERSVTAGLQHARDTSYFRGHLFEVHGLVEEARGARLADAGNAAAARSARSRAVLLLDQAIKIQEEVVTRSLAAKDGGR